MSHVSLAFEQEIAWARTGRPPVSLHTYAMAERSKCLDFDIRGPEELPQPPAAHRHDHFQIIVMLAGSAVQTVSGAMKQVGPGTLTFVLPYRLHFAQMPQDADYRVINFCGDFARLDMPSMPLSLKHVIESGTSELAPFVVQEYVDFTFEGDEFDQLRVLLQKMAREREHRGFGADMMLRGLLYQLLAMVCKGHRQAVMQALEKHAPQAQHRWLSHALRYIRTHISDDVTLHDVADAAHLTPSHLARLFRQDTGKTFVDVLTEERLRRACELLLNSPMRIGEVAAATGFCDESYFARRFRRSFRMSPSEFRRKYEEGRVRLC